MKSEKEAIEGRESHLCSTLMNTEKEGPPAGCIGLKFAQRRGNGQTRGTERRKESANESNYGRPDDAPHEQFAGHLKSKSDLAETLKIHRRGLKSVEGKVRHACSNDSAQKGKHQRLDHDRNHHCSAAKSERPQGGDFAGPRRDG